MTQIGPETEVTYIAERVMNPAAKWALQTEVKRIMFGTDTSKGLQDCCWKMHSASITWRRDAEKRKASFQGCVTCKGTWICPPCMTRLQSARALEIQAGMDQWRDNHNGEVKMITFTFSHKRGDQLPVMLEQFSKAMTFFTNSRAWRNTLTEVGSPGRVTAQEYTYGPKTGHHPHRHALVFIKKGTWRVRHTVALKREWKRSAARAGLKASLEHGADVRDGNSAGSYLCKLALEMALNVTKLGAGDRSTPMGLVAQSMDGNQAAAGVFREYAAAYKGKRQLVWTSGLKELLSVEQITDLEILEAGEPYADFALMDPQGWKGLRAKKLIAEAVELIGATPDLRHITHQLTIWGIDPDTFTPILEGKPICLKRRKPKTESNHEPVSAPGVVENSN